jgi:pilus assembly protein CpaC
LLQHRVESENRGIPVLADMPWVGAAFRRIEERVNEVELLFLVRPEFVDDLDPCEVPPCGPGEFTTTPNGVEFYGRGYTEVPKCCEGGACGLGSGSAAMGGYETYTPGIAVPVEAPAAPLGPAPGVVPETIPNPNFGNNRAPRSAVIPASAGIAEPSFIGPLGYDVLKK